jgi:ATP-dependent Lon protease
MADLEEVPQEIRDELEFVPASKMDDVLCHALSDPSKLKLRPTDQRDEAPSSEVSANP